MITELQIRVFYSADNFNTDFEDPESCRRHVENQMGPRRALEGNWKEAKKNFSA